MMSDDKLGCILFVIFVLFFMAFYPAAFLVVLGILVIVSFLAQFIGMFWD